MKAALPRLITGLSAEQINGLSSPSQAGFHQREIRSHDGLKGDYNSRTVNIRAQKETEDTRGVRRKRQIEQQGADTSKTGQNLGSTKNIGEKPGEAVK